MQKLHRLSPSELLLSLMMFINHVCSWDQMIWNSMMAILTFVIWRTSSRNCWSYWNRRRNLSTHNFSNVTWAVRSFLWWKIWSSFEIRGGDCGRWQLIPMTAVVWKSFMAFAISLIFCGRRCSFHFGFWDLISQRATSIDYNHTFAICTYWTCMVRYSFVRLFIQRIIALGHF